MTIARGFAITLASGIAFGAIGGGLGYALGRLTPDFYRTVFRIPRETPLDLAQAGFGLGLTQGLLVGLFVGLVITAIVAWSNSRRERPSS